MHTLLAYKNAVPTSEKDHFDEGTRRISLNHMCLDLVERCPSIGTFIDQICAQNNPVNGMVSQLNHAIKIIQEQSLYQNFDETRLRNVQGNIRVFKNDEADFYSM